MKKIKFFLVILTFFLSFNLFSENYRFEKNPDGTYKAIYVIYDDGRSETIIPEKYVTGKYKAIYTRQIAGDVHTDTIVSISDTNSKIRYNPSTDTWQYTNDGINWNNFGSGGGATSFLNLTDTPNSYEGQAGKVVKVKDTEDGLEFVDIPSGGSETPGGNNKAIQYNDNGVFAGDDNLTWDSGLQQLSITSQNSAIKIQAIPTIYDFKNRTGVDEQIEYYREAFKFVPNQNASSFIIIVRMKNTDTDSDAQIALKLFSDYYGYPNEELATSNSVLIPKNSDYAEYIFVFNCSVSQGSAYWIVIDYPYLPFGYLYLDRDNSGDYEYAYDAFGWWELENEKGVWYKFGAYETKAFDIDENAKIILKSNNLIAIGKEKRTNGINEIHFGFLENDKTKSGLKLKQFTPNNTEILFNHWFFRCGYHGEEIDTLSLGISDNKIYFTNRNAVNERGEVDENNATFWKIEKSGDNYELKYYYRGSETISLGHNWGRNLKIFGIDYQFPSQQGSAGSVLTNNGSGVLSWTQPVGGSGKAQISQISVGSSPFVYQQTTYNLASVIVSGGSVSSIEISRNGTGWYNVGLTQGQFVLNKNDRIRITYTEAPNMHLMEH